MKSWLPIFIFIIAASLLAWRTHQRKVQVVIIPVAAMNKTLDSINAFVLPYIGKSLSVDQSDQVKNAHTGFLNNLISVSRIDSLEIK